MLRASLTSSLLAALSDPSNRKSTTVHLTGLLARVSASAAARNAFLNSRATLTRQRVRMIRFEGHVQLYISDLATVVFTGIKHTADWFLASFKENDVASCMSCVEYSLAEMRLKRLTAFIEWAKQHIENFAEMFRKQVYSPDVDAKTVEEALQVTQLQSKKVSDLSVT